MFINVLAQQPEGQLQKQHKLYIYIYKVNS